MDGLLSPDRIRALLEELAQRLSDSGASAGVRVVGGAAISFLDPARRVTMDIDAVIVPSAAAGSIVSEMAREHDLAAKWLNDAALAYFPLVGAEDWIEIHRAGDVVVSIGSAPMLLAMKLRANRGVRDSDDIGFLLSACGVTSVEEAQEIYESYHAQEVLSESAQARVRYFLENPV